MRKIAIFLGVLCGVLCASRVVNAETVATGGPGAAFGWQTAEKQGIGTAYLAPGAEPKSRVWFTLARGIVTEMYFPRVDTAQVRDSQFLVSDGSSFLHQEQFDMESSVKRIEGSLAFEIVNKDRERRYEIRKTVWADPQSDTLYQRVLFKSFVDGLHLYYLHNPAAANSIFGDTAVRDPELAAGEEHGMFSAWHSVQSSVGWLKKSVGYVGRSDGFTDLSADFKMDFEFDRAPQGNVALTGQLNLPAKKGTYAATIAIRFANRQGELASGPLPESQPSLDSYLAGWRAYLSGLDLNVGENAPERRQKLAEHSILILKASEDKTFLGAGIASLSHPWGEAQTENEHVNPYGNSGYHVVWPRDLYHVGNAFLAVNDTHSAVAVLDRMRSVQFDDADGDWQFGTRSRKKREVSRRIFGWMGVRTGKGIKRIKLQCPYSLRTVFGKPI